MVASPAEPSARRLWWALLLERLRQVSLTLPRDLTGTIQFELAGPGEPHLHHVVLDGPKTEARDGEAPGWDAKVVSHEEAVAALLFAESPPAGALVVHGNFQKFEALMRALEGAPAAKSWIGIRSKR